MTASLHEKPSDQFVGGGLGFGFIFALIGSAAAAHLPFAALWPAETVIFTGGFAGMTLHKRNRWGWLWTGYVAAVCLAKVVAHVIPGVGASRAAAGLFWAAGAMIAIGWYCMLHLERNRRPDPLPVQQTVHHYVFHGLPGGAQLPIAPVPGEVMRVPDLPGITAPRQPRAIEAPRVQDSLTRRLAARVPVKVTRRARTAGRGRS